MKKKRRKRERNVAMDLERNASIAWELPRRTIKKCKENAYMVLMLIVSTVWVWHQILSRMWVILAITHQAKDALTVPPTTSRSKTQGISHSNTLLRTSRWNARGNTHLIKSAKIVCRSRTYLTKWRKSAQELTDHTLNRCVTNVSLSRSSWKDNPTDILTMCQCETSKSYRTLCITGSRITSCNKE